MKFINKKRKLSNSDIKKVEDIIGFNFPVDFKKFIIKNNGGRIVSKDSYYSDKIGWVSTGWFLTLLESDLYDILITYHNMNKQYKIKKNFLPFCIDDLGNYFVLECMEEYTNSKVYFLDHETGELYKLANSLNQFFNSLEEFPLIEN